MRNKSNAVVLISMILVSGWSCSPRRPPDDADDYFFPAGIFDPIQPELDKLAHTWYSKHLRAMQEPSLSRGKSAAESTYRLLWLRSFHHPISVRVEINGSTAVLHAVELDGAGGYAPGNVVKRVQRELSPADRERIMTRLNKMDFWKMATNEGDGGLDGAEWVLEGARNGQYHVVNRWSPESGDYRDACLVFLELAGLPIPLEQIY